MDHNRVLLVYHKICRKQTDCKVKVFIGISSVFCLVSQQVARQMNILRKIELKVHPEEYRFYVIMESMHVEFRGRTGI